MTRCICDLGDKLIDSGDEVVGVVPLARPMNKSNLDAAVAALTGIGFRKRAGGIFTLELAPGVLGWLGLNTATKYRARGEAEVNPVIGVRFQDVQRLVAECCGDKFHPYNPPTISTPLGYLMPEKKYVAWVFAPGRAETAAAEMATAIAAHGVAFMRSVTDLAELRRQMHVRGVGLGHQLAYTRPAAALLAGDTEQARALLDEELMETRARTDLAAERFRKFAESLRTRLQPRK